MKVTSKGNDFYICVLRMQNGKFLFQECQEFEVFKMMDQLKKLIAKEKL